MRGSVARRTNTPRLWHFESPGESQQEGAARLTQCPAKGPQHPSARSRQKAPGSPSLRCHVVESCGFYLPNVLRSTAAHPLIVPGTSRGCACLRALARAAVAARDAYPGRPVAHASVTFGSSLDRRRSERFRGHRVTTVISAPQQPGFLLSHSSLFCVLCIALERALSFAYLLFL